MLTGVSAVAMVTQHSSYVPDGCRNVKISGELHLWSGRRADTQRPSGWKLPSAGWAGAGWGCRKTPGFLNMWFMSWAGGRGSCFAVSSPPMRPCARLKTAHVCLIDWIFLVFGILPLLGSCRERERHAVQSAVCLLCGVHLNYSSIRLQWMNFFDHKTRSESEYEISGLICDDFKCFITRSWLFHWIWGCFPHRSY